MSKPTSSHIFTEVIDSGLIRHLFRLVLVFALVVCCSPTGAQEFSEAALAKAPPGLLTRVSDAAPTELIILLDDSEIAKNAKALRFSRGVTIDDDYIRNLKTTGYANIKSEFLREIVAGDFEVITDYLRLPMIFGRIASRKALSHVLSNDKVVSVYENEPHFLSLVESLEVIHQDAAAAANHLGQETTVAVLDTGADYTRDALGNCSSPGIPETCKVIFAQDFTPEDDGALDAHGHGTNVSGIVLGVAPETRIAALDVFTGDSAYVSDIIAAIDWIIANQSTYNIVAMNMSLGASNSSTECPGSWAVTPFASARDAGVTPVVSSGNDARKSSLSNPACTPGAVSVGATYDSALGRMGWFSCTDNETQVDLVTCFSNSASTLKLLAPGAVITAAGLTMSGTSMAAPHVAGAYAVLRSVSAYPDDTIDQTLDRLTSTGQPVVDPANALTHPRIDLAAALSVPIPGDLPKVTAFSPTRASQGQSVTIHGSGFSGISSVTFGGVPAQSYVVDSALKISAIVGTGATGSVIVVNAEGSDSLPGFEFRDASLVSISAVPPDIEFDAFGQFTQLNVIALFSDSSQEDVTNSSSFESSNTSIASVNSLGKVTALGNGEALITASNSGLQAQTSISVSFSTIGSREIEPNNSVQQANPVALQGAAFAGQLSSTSDVDFFILSSEQAGKLTVLIGPENDIYDGGSVRASVLDTDGNTLAAKIIRSDDSGASAVRVLLPAPGTILLRVDQRPGYTIFDKDYEVETLFDIDPTVFMRRELEPNPSFDSATDLPASGGSFAGQLYSTEDTDFYRFDIAKKGALSLLIDPENDRYDGGSIRTAILNAAGETLAARIVRSDQSLVTNLSALISEPGPIFLRVDQRPGYTIFDKDYLVETHFSDDPLVFSTRETEVNNSFERANPFATNGAVISGQLYDTSDIDVFAFGLDSGVVTFGIQPENLRYDGGSIRVTLKDSSDNVLSSRIVRSDEPSVIDLDAGIGQRGLYYLVVDQRPGYTIFDKDYQVSLPLSDFPNQAPSFASQPPLSAAIGQPYFYEITATDADGDQLFFSILAGPTGLKISEGTSTVTWTPTGEQWGENYVDIMVSDNFGGIDTQHFIISVPNTDLLFKDGFELE